MQVDISSRSHIVPRSHLCPQAQSNYTLMNTLLWGTCNIDLGVNQCRANMGWLAESLQQECEMDLNDRNDLALDALTGKLKLPYIFLRRLTLTWYSNECLSTHVRRSVHVEPFNKHILLHRSPSQNGFSRLVSIPITLRTISTFERNRSYMLTMFKERFESLL